MRADSKEESRHKSLFILDIQSMLLCVGMMLEILYTETRVGVRGVAQRG